MTRRIDRPDADEDAAITDAASRDENNPPLTDADLAGFRRTRGPQRTPTKRQVTMRLDADLLQRLKDDGPGWQTRANDLLRKAMQL